jgi:hypothetical protein
MVISRLDLSHIKQTIETFYRLLENPRYTLPDLAVPEGWQPCPPSTTLAIQPIVENWSPPNWWVSFCDAIYDPDDPDGRRLDPKTPPPLTGVFRALSELLLAQLMPSGVFRPDDGPDHVDDIVDSQLDESQKLALVNVCHELAPWGAFQKIMEGKGTRLRFKKLLEDAMNALGDKTGSATSTTAIAKAKQKIPVREANERVAAYLKNYGKNDPSKVTIRAVKEATGVPTGSIAKTAAWKAFEGERKKRRPPAKPRNIALSDQMRAAIPDARTNSPAEIETEKELSDLIAEQKHDKEADERPRKRRGS